MSSKLTIEKNTEAQVNAVNIKTLSDRPNVVSRYGDGGLSATQLKERFDGFPALNREKINQIIDALTGAESTKYLGIGTEALSEFGVDNLYDLLVKMTTAEISNVLKALHATEKDAESKAYTLNEIFSDVGSRLSELKVQADKVPGIDSRLTTAEGAINALAQENVGQGAQIAQIQQDNVNQHNAIEAVRSKAETEYKNIAATFNNHNERILTWEAWQQKNEAQINKTIVGAGENRSRIVSLEDAVKDISGALESIVPEGSEITNNLPTITNRVAEAEENINEALENVQELSAEVDAHIAEADKHIEDAAKELDKFDAELKEYSDTVSGYDARISATEETVANYDEVIAGVSQYDARITGIETYLGGENFVIDDREDYMKTVPNNACETAKLLKIGTGTTYEVPADSGNLFPYPYADVLDAEEYDGGVILASNRVAEITIATEPVALPAGTYILDLGNTNVSGLYVYSYPNRATIEFERASTTGKFEFTITEVTNFAGIVINSTGELDGQYFYPLMYKEDEFAMWEPRGTKLLEDSRVTELRSVGKNLLDVSQALNEDFYYKGDGQYGFDRTAESKVFPLYLPGNGHMLKFTGTRVGGGSSLTLNLYYNYPAVNISEDIKGVSMNSSFSLTKDVQYASFVCSGGREPGITVAHLQLAYTADGTDYEPFSGASLFEIPNEVQELDSFGAAANPKVAAMNRPSENDYCNYIEYRNGGWFYVKRSHKMVLVGEEDWIDPGRGSVYLEVPEAAWLDLSTPRDEWSQVWGMAGPLPLDDKDVGIDNSVSIGYGLCVLNVDGLDTVDDVKQYLADLNNRGTPLTVVYALEYPEEIEISDLMPRPALLGVAPGRYIYTKQDNDKHFNIPTSIKYLVYYQKGETL